MKKTIVALGLVLTSSFALAQTSAYPQSSAKEITKPPHAERMQNDLNLTKEQAQKMRDIRNNGGTREEMQAVLTPEQRAKAVELRKERKGERKAHMQKQLDLSDEQQKQLDKIRADGGSREEMRAVLTPEQQTKFDEMRSKHAAKAAQGKASGGGKKPAKKPADAPVETPAT